MSWLSSLALTVSSFAVVVFCVIAFKSRKVDKERYKKGIRYAGISFFIMIASSFGIEEEVETTDEGDQEIQGIVAQSDAEAKKAEAEAKAKEVEEARLKAEAEEAAKKAQAEAEEAAKKAQAEAVAAAVAAAKAEEERIAEAKAEEQAKAQVVQQQQANTAQESFKNCTEMRKVYPNGVASSHPAYAGKHDRDKDGWACE